MVSKRTVIRNFCGEYGWQVMRWPDSEHGLYLCRDYNGRVCYLYVSGLGEVCSSYDDGYTWTVEAVNIYYRTAHR